MFILEEKRLVNDCTSLYNNLKGGCNDVEVIFFPKLRKKNLKRVNGHNLHQILDWILRKIYPWRGLLSIGADCTGK